MSRKFLCVRLALAAAAVLLTATAVRVTAAQTDSLDSDFGSTQFAYVANEDSNDVSGYKLDAATGALTPVPGSPFTTGKSGPTSVAVDPAGRFLYVTNQYAQDNDVAGFSIDRATGKLTAVPGSPFKAGSGPASIAIDPSGKFAYVANLGSNNVSAYTIDRYSGRLVPISGSPFAAGSSPSHVAVDPLGKFVYVTNEMSNNVSGYTINSTSGALTAIAGSPFPAGTFPLSVAVDPNDRFVYVANQGSNNISGYTIDATTGALIVLDTSPYAAGGGGVYSVTVDPSGSFVYVAGYGGVFAYGIDQNSSDFSSPPPLSLYGKLTPLSGSPFGGGSPNFVAVDYTGTFLYAANQSSNDVSAYKISSGALTAISGSPFAAGMGPVSIALVRPSTIPLYSATQIPYPQTGFGGVQTFTASGINNKGQVAGSIVYYPTLFERFATGFLYAGGTTITVGFNRTSTANGINNSTEVVGQTALGPPVQGGPPSQAFLYTNGSQIDIDNVQGRQSAAFSINNVGHITGSLSTATCATPFACNLGDTHAFLYTGSGLADIGTLGGNFSEGRGINNLGEIVGGSNLIANGPNHLFLYTQGAMHDLGTVDGNSTEGTQINDRGEIIGTPGFLYSEGRFHQLPISASGINNLGVIVGSKTVANGSSHAFLDIDGQLIDLNRLVDPSLTLLTGAAGVSDNGGIVAYGVNKQIYVLTPRH